MIDVQIIPVLKDNYAYLLTASDGTTAILDPGDAPPIIDVLNAQNLTLDYILNTHHHWDHTDGNEELRKKYNAKIVGPASEKSRIDNMSVLLSEDDTFKFGDEEFHILETPGHTTGHICFYAPKSKIVFTADTLFLLGCGRIFEGTPEIMWESLQKIMALPDDTKVYAGHEYTLSLGKFCKKIEPDNQDLIERIALEKEKRRKKQPTMPSTIGLEAKTNAFVRAKTAERFTQIRHLRDQS